jgi:hypothetical protein
MEKENIIIQSELSCVFKVITFVLGIISLIVCFIVNSYMTYYVYNIVVWSVFVVVVLVLIVLNWSFSGVKLVVTDKRVYGKNAFRKRVDLPLDSITAVATTILKGVAVASSSGRIVFWGLSNREDLYKAINDLLIDIQSRNIKGEESGQQNISEVDKLKKFKELLDSGVITKDEFEAKKKKILDL